MPIAETGAKRRVRGELFADHYSQARQFYLSQAEIEQTHIKDAFVFELSKVETVAIRARVVSHLLNVDKTLVGKVADGLGMKSMPKAAEPARPVITSLAKSPALSIIGNPINTFRGRKIGVLVSDGTDADLLKALMAAAAAEGTMIELVAPKVGGFTDSAGTLHEARQKVNGGPSVLYDAVAVLVSEQGAKLLLGEATAKDFLNDAYAHAKFIGCADASAALFAKAGLTDMDNGIIPLKTATDAKKFIEAYRKLRFWAREAKVHAV